ncbi:hypothetical protein RJ45_08870 [Photobacterium gaetbulicola]|uniref:Porin n=1 Tax=Photobacterium gaetbulicola TaxID=1295392 RepID=A0A0B9H533_9GAMM|nr:hypothetical protein [Photobacterium gaetbulicola]KHT64007.1 hypothetical protein RJ45_08870 [Photobacterium gaetbulicola]
MNRYLMALGLLLSTQAGAIEWKKAFSYRANAEAYTTRYDLNNHSYFNPGNTIGELPDYENTFLLRGYILGEFDGFTASLSPNIKYTKSKINSKYVYDDEIYLQEYNVSYLLGSWKFSVYRELDFWGPSLFTSPSNPFYATTDQSNPFVEEPALDFIRLDGYHGDSFSSSLIYSYNKGRTENLIHPFEKTLSFKVDYVSYSYYAGAIVSRQDKTNLFGVFGQWTVSDSVMLYSDIGVKDRSTAYIPVESANALGYDFEVSSSDRHFYTDGVIGLSYSTMGGSTYNLEYRYNQEGYNKSQLDTYYDLAKAAGGSLGSSDLGGMSQYLLYIASDPGMRTIGRNYIYAQYFKRDVIPDLSVNFILAHDIDTQSSELTSVVNYYLNDNVGVSGNFILTHGDDKRSEFTRYIENVLYLGVKYYF